MPLISPPTPPHIEPPTQSTAETMAGLTSADPAVRWAAARQLEHNAVATRALCSALAVERVDPVREALLNALYTIGTVDVAAELVALLRSETAAVRNGSIEILRLLPAVSEPLLVALLADADSDLRLFAVEVLRQLNHPKAPEHLAAVLAQESHINVVAAALEGAAELGLPTLAAAVRGAKARFAEQPFIAFAADAALRSIDGASAQDDG